MATRTRDHPIAAVPAMPVYRFTSDQYRRMIRAGTFPDERVELLDGWIVPKMTRHRPHVIAQLRTFEALRSIVPAGWHVEQEASPTVSDLSTPEPDIMVVRGQPEDDPDDPPTAADAALVVEVTESSLHDDRRKKLPIYAASGIPYTWLVNLVFRVVEVYEDPTGPAPVPSYRSSATFGLDGEIPMIIGGIEVARIAVRHLFA